MDVKDILEKMAYFERICFPEDFLRFVNHSLITQGYSDQFAIEETKELLRLYKKYGSITRLYQEVIDCEDYTKAIAYLVESLLKDK